MEQNENTKINRYTSRFDAARFLLLFYLLDRTRSGHTELFHGYRSRSLLDELKRLVSSIRSFIVSTYTAVQKFFATSFRVSVATKEVNTMLETLIDDPVNDTSFRLEATLDHDVDARLALPFLCLRRSTSSLLTLGLVTEFGNPSFLDTFIIMLYGDGWQFSQSRSPLYDASQQVEACRFYCGQAERSVFIDNPRLLLYLNYNRVPRLLYKPTASDIISTPSELMNNLVYSKILRALEIEGEDLVTQLKIYSHATRSTHGATEDVQFIYSSFTQTIARIAERLKELETNPKTANALYLQIYELSKNVQLVL